MAAEANKGTAMNAIKDHVTKTCNDNVNAINAAISDLKKLINENNTKMTHISADINNLETIMKQKFELIESKLNNRGVSVEPKTRSNPASPSKPADENKLPANNRAYFIAEYVKDYNKHLTFVVEKLKVNVDTIMDVVKKDSKYDPNKSDKLKREATIIWDNYIKTDKSGEINKHYRDELNAAKKKIATDQKNSEVALVPEPYNGASAKDEFSELEGDAN